MYVLNVGCLPYMVMNVGVAFVIAFVAVGMFRLLVCCIVQLDKAM